MHKTQKLQGQTLKLFAVRTGLEPATPCVTGTYSNQLNYRTVVKFQHSETESKSRDLNP